jgi:hypothetical protein
MPLVVLLGTMGSSPGIDELLLSCWRTPCHIRGVGSVGSRRQSLASCHNRVVQLPECYLLHPCLPARAGGCSGWLPSGRGWMMKTTTTMTTVRLACRAPCSRRCLFPKLSLCQPLQPTVPACWLCVRPQLISVADLYKTVEEQQVHLWCIPPQATSIGARTRMRRCPAPSTRSTPSSSSQVGTSLQAGGAGHHEVSAWLFAGMRTCACHAAVCTWC